MVTADTRTSKTGSRETFFIYICKFLHFQGDQGGTSLEFHKYRAFCSGQPIATTVVQLRMR